MLCLIWRICVCEHCAGVDTHCLTATELREVTVVHTCAPGELETLAIWLTRVVSIASGVAQLHSH